MKRSLPLLALCALAVPAHANGHFDVDNAGTLDPGQCQYETWGGRTGADRTTVYHLGPACRVGPVELRLNLDRASLSDGRSDSVSPQLKWTFLGQAADARFSAALSMTASFDVTHGGRTGGQFVLPVSWQPIDNVWVHANLGVDWESGTGVRTGRGGLGGEWAVDPRVSLIAERFRSQDVWTSRAGMRVNFTPAVSVDLSGARVDGKAWGFVIGLNHGFIGF